MTRVYEIRSTTTSASGISSRGSRREALRRRYNLWHHNEYGFRLLRDNMVREVTAAAAQFAYAMWTRWTRFLIDERARRLINLPLPARRAALLMPSLPSSSASIVKDKHYETDEKRQSVILDR